MKSTASSRASGRLAPDALLRTGVAVGLGAFVALAAASLAFEFDATRLAAWLPGCVFRALSGIECPGCGMTRALLLLAQLRVADSLAAHPAALPATLFAALWSAWTGWLAWTGSSVSPGWPLRLGRCVAKRRSALATLALVVLLGLWAQRVLPTL